MTYSLSPSGVLMTGEELRRENKVIAGLLSNLDAAVQQFTNVNEGLAPESFVQAQRTWRAGMDRMNLTLNNAATALDEIVHTYDGADRAGSRLF